MTPEDEALELAREAGFDTPYEFVEGDRYNLIQLIALARAPLEKRVKELEADNEYWVPKGEGEWTDEQWLRNQLLMIYQQTQEFVAEGERHADRAIAVSPQEPSQEPVGYITEEVLQALRDPEWQAKRNETMPIWTTDNPPSRCIVPLYASPQPQAPSSDDALQAALADARNSALEKAAKVCEARIRDNKDDIGEAMDNEAHMCAAAIRALRTNSEK